MPGQVAEKISNALVNVSVVLSLVTIIPRGSAPTKECVNIRNTRRLYSSMPPLG